VSSDRRKSDAAKPKPVTPRGSAPPPA